MSLTGGKRKVNKGLKDWVAFVKKVQKEEKLSYKDAIHRAKVRKDKGEKWMSGGMASLMKGGEGMEEEEVRMTTMGSEGGEEMIGEEEMVGADENVEMEMGGGRRRRRRTMRKSRGKGRGRTMRRRRSRASRRH